MSIMSSRRRCLAMGPVLLAAALLLPGRSSLAHHGFLGKHDFARPMFLQGRVLHVDAALPHVRIRVRVPRGGGRVPRGREWMRPLEDAEARPTLTIIRAFDRTGEVELTFDWRLSRAILDDPALVMPDDEIAVVVYRRTSHDEYRGELLVVLLRTADDEVLVSSRPPSPRPSSSSPSPSPSPRKAGASVP
ncbi:MAG: hypothetical protein Q4E06_02635 [Lautropia sp.]|nr:hypothetical protein [Lautropia sp.]